MGRVYDNGCHIYRDVARAEAIGIMMIAIVVLIHRIRVAAAVSGYGSRLVIACFDGGVTTGSGVAMANISQRGT